MARKKKQSNWYYFIRFFAITTLLLFAFAIYKVIQSRWPNSKNWDSNSKVIFQEFGVPMPLHYDIHGIDISKYQRTIDWNLVTTMEVEGIKMGFVFIKATEGTELTDRNFDRNWKEAKASGIVRGAYHFFLATENGIKQARFFLDKVHFEKGDLPPVIDIEHLYRVHPQKMRERLQACLDLLEQETGVLPIIYTSVGFYKSYLGDTFDKYPLWIAHYQQLERPGIHRDWSFWQHNESGNISGIVSKVDLNVFSGDSSSFKKMMIP